MELCSASAMMLHNANGNNDKFTVTAIFCQMSSGPMDLFFSFLPTFFEIVHMCVPIYKVYAYKLFEWAIMNILPLVAILFFHICGYLCNPCWTDRFVFAYT